MSPLLPGASMQPIKAFSSKEKRTSLHLNINIFWEINVGPSKVNIVLYQILKEGVSFCNVFKLIL